MAPRTDARTRAEALIFDLENLTGRQVTFSVTSAVHASGNLTGTVVTIAYLPGACRAVDAHVVIDTGCTALVLPLDRVLSHHLTNG